MRLHLFEFEDLPWFPNVIRVGGTDYLRYLLIVTEVYKPCIKLLNDVLKEIGETKIVDLCSGGGGYIEQVCRELEMISPEKIAITLTDKFPNIDAYKHLEKKTGGK